MKRLVLLLLIPVFPIALNAQDYRDTTKVIRICPASVTDLPPAPLFYLVLDSIEIYLDSMNFTVLKPEHIESIDVLKNPEVLKEYDTDVGVVRIYPKKNFLQFYREKYLRKDVNGTYQYRI